jgi:hypothetical protein
MSDEEEVTSRNSRHALYLSLVVIAAVIAMFVIGYFWR